MQSKSTRFVHVCKLATFFLTCVCLGITLLLACFEALLRVGIVKSDYGAAQAASAAARAEAREKPCRVLMIGDSFIATPTGFGPRLAARLKSPQVYCYNAGNVGTGPVSYYRSYLDHRDEVRPTLVILSYYVGNDLTDMLRERDMLRDLDAPVAVAPPGLWYEASYVYQYVQAVRGSIRFRQECAKAAQRARTRSVPVVNPFLAEIANTRPDYLINNLLMEGDGMADAWRGVQTVLTRLQNEVRSRNATLLVVVSPRELQINDSHVSFWKSLGARLDPRLATTDAPQRALQALCKALGIPFLDLLPEFRRHASHQFYLQNDDHMNDVGKELSALWISRYIAKNRLLSVPAPAVH